MYELINTSLPNGLIPGTHGFATVAMTRGMPDTLRSRLETYCAYSHRTGVHDATYFKENPVNWIHVVLPQGEHVVGRVAPADFDYTGRTNRLARLLVFSKDEMPAIGAASVLQKESRRFSEPWSGEARWLDPDKLTPGRMRLSVPPENTDAPAWRAMFGETTGLDIAKGFARLLAKNMASGGRTIYFKTSTKHDVDGTKLLTLFADLIDLLPVADRLKVSFATYPVALPQGTICHLRGVYDRDRMFDAAAVTQPWVDCEHGTVHNTVLLPPEETRKVITAVKPSSSLEKYPPRPSRGTSCGTGTKSRSVQDLLSPEKDGTKTLFIGILAVVLVLVIGAIGLGVWLYIDHKPKTGNPGIGKTTVACTDTTGDATGKVQNGGEKGTEHNGTNGTPAVVVKSGTEAQHNQVAAKNEVKLDSKAPRKDEAAKGAAGARCTQNDEIAPEKPKNEESKERNLAFAEANDVFSLEGGVKAKFVGNERRMTNGSLRVYWYDKNGILTNAPAGFSPPKNKTIKNASWRFDPDPKKLVGETSGMFLIWLEVEANKAYWDWTPLVEKMEYEAWFARTNCVNLAERCFGSEPAVCKIFEKLRKRPWRFEVEQEGVDKPIVVTNNVLSLDYFDPKDDDKFRQQETALTNQLEQARKMYVSATNELANIEEYESKMSDLENVENARSALSEKEKSDKEKELRKQKRTLEDEIEKILKEKLGIDKKPVQAKSGVKTRKENAEKKKKKAVDDQETRKSELSELKQNWRKKLRRAKFRIRKVEGR